MSRASLSLSICLSLGLGLSACGDDSNPGGGGETDTDAGSTTDAPTTDEPTTDEPTTDEPTTDDGTTTTGETDTVDPDSSSGDPADTDTEGETTGVVPMDADYRVNSLGILDPPLTYLMFPINGAASEALTTSLTTDEDEDGDLDLGFVLQFRPLDQSDGASEGFGFANASCTAPEETSTCDVLMDTVVSEGTYSSSADECYAADPANVSSADVPPTAGPCFISEYPTLTIQAGLFELPLQDVRIAASYVGEPAGNLINGNLEGFVTIEVAESTQVETELFTGPLSDLLDLADADNDETGWVFHMNFTAVETEWTGA
ncbi:MAG: hypothetical protein ACE37F_34990 [Nannocystaceae bacterium]|nr:hypothetical protein [bacterium]